METHTFSIFQCWVEGGKNTTFPSFHYQTRQKNNEVFLADAECQQLN